MPDPTTAPPQAETAEEPMAPIKKEPAPQTGLERLEESADHMEKDAAALIVRAGRVRAFLAAARDNPPLQPTLEAFVNELYQR